MFKHKGKIDTLNEVGQPTPLWVIALSLAAQVTPNVSISSCFGYWDWIAWF